MDKNKFKQLFEQAELTVVSEMAKGRKFEWSDEVVSGKKTIQEMIGTDDGAREFIEKITYDLYTGREAVPLIYPQLYQTISDRGLPETFTVKEFGPTQVVFLEKFEGGEVKFGALGAGPEKVVQMHTWAAGIEYNEDMVEYNQFWRLSEVGTAFGEAYNKLLNHLHLSPILLANYVATGSDLEDQKAAQKAGTAQLIEFDTDLPTTLRNALSVLPNGTKLLVNSADQFLLEDAIASSMYADTTPSVVKRRLSSGSFIVYEGDEIEVGGKTYSYPGVEAGEAYLIVPKRNFREYVKHDLRVTSGDGDLSRLIVEQIVGRTRRGVLNALGTKDGVVKIELTS